VPTLAPLPLDLVLSGREITEPRLSPDGTMVAFVHRYGPAAAISVVPAAGGPERLVTFGPEPAPGRGTGGGCYAWLPGSDGIVYAARDGELWSLAGPSLRQLTTYGRECRAPVLDAGGTVVFHAVDEAEVWACRLADGRTWRLDDGRHEFCFDPAVSPDGTVVSWLGWSPPDMPWDGAVRVDLRHRSGVPVVAPAGSDDLSITAWHPRGGAVQQPRFAPDGSPTCVHDGSGWANVYVADRAVLPEPAEHAGPAWGMGQRSYDVGIDGSAVVARTRAGYGSLVVVGAEGVRDLAPGFVGVFGQVSTAGDRIAALRSGPTTPPEVVVIDDQGLRVVAASGVSAWDEVAMADPEPLTVPHDGTHLHGRLYPTADSTGRLLCWVHGGPTDQWPVDHRPRIAYWRSRGWDVVTVDPRGTTGHGRDYQRALNGRWGRLDVDDTAAILTHLHSRHGAARDAPPAFVPARTVVIGGSAGGLTVLGLLADHPHLVAGGIASYPVSDLAALAEATHRFEAHYTHTLVGPPGDPRTDQAFHDHSPVHRAERIRGPLLVFHGGSDPVVPVSQSERLVQRVLAAGGDVDYVVYPDEGHGFRDPATVRDEYARVEQFLARAVT
jgi:dipeptidyl aminopeptidase/acylaminoacyl peptidase